MMQEKTHIFENSCHTEESDLTKWEHEILVSAPMLIRENLRKNLSLHSTFKMV